MLVSFVIQIEGGEQAVNQQIRQWYEQYKTGLFRYALSILKDVGQAEDVLQEIFLRLLSGGHVPVPGKEQAYLYRMARNLCYDELRRQRRQGEFPMQPQNSPEEMGYLELVAPLEPKAREIVTLKIVGGLTHKEIGKVLGLTESAARKRYQRALEKLREE